MGVADTVRLDGRVSTAVGPADLLGDVETVAENVVHPEDVDVPEIEGMEVDGVVGSKEVQLVAPAALVVPGGQV